MKIIILFAVLTIAVADDPDYYKIDEIKVDEQNVNVPRLQTFLDCYNDVGPCTEIAAVYKQHFPDAIKQACRRCSPAQMHLFRQFLDITKKHLPAQYSLFKQKYDPENKYFDALEKEISKY